MVCSSIEHRLRITMPGKSLEIRDGAGKISFRISSKYGLHSSRCSDIQGVISNNCQSENFTPAALSFAQEFDISWDLSVHGSGGPVQSSYPVFQWQEISMHPSQIASRF